MVYENDNFSIPEEIKKMSLEEIQREKERLYKELKGNNKIEQIQDKEKGQLCYLFSFSNILIEIYKKGETNNGFCNNTKRYEGI